MAMKRVYALIGCVALAAAGCSQSGSSDDSTSGGSGGGNSSNSNVDAQHVVNEFTQARGDDPIPSYDQTYDMTMDMEIEVQGQTINVDAQIEGEESASQKMSSGKLSMAFSAAGGSTEYNADVQTYIGEEGDGYRIYVGANTGTGTGDQSGETTWAQQAMTADEIQQFQGNQNYSTMFSSFVADAENVQVSEEGDSYVIDVELNQEAIEELLAAGVRGESVTIDELTVNSGSFQMTVDKETYHAQKIDMDYDADITVEGEQANMKIKTEGTFDDSQDVNIDLPQEAKDAPERDIESLLTGR